MPYNYYQIVRFSGMIGFSILAFLCYEANKKNESIIYIALALLFQPFIKVALGRFVWNVVDVVVAIGLICSLGYKKRDPKKDI